MTSFIDKKSLIKAMLSVFTILVLTFLRFYSYLLFHFSIEAITAMIGFFMLVIIINTMNFSKNKPYIYIGIAYAFMGSIDLMHAIVYKGMNIVNVTTANASTQLWIMARYTQSISLLLIFAFMGRDVKYIKVIAMYCLITIYAVAVVFNGQLFPECYIDGVGLTKFKIASEYIICTILVVAIYFLYRNKNKYNFINRDYIYLLASIILTILSEICFTLYVDSNEFSNFLGHIFKFLAFYHIYLSLIQKNLQEPYKIIFNSLSESLEQLKIANDQLNAKNNELEEIKWNLEKNLKIYKDFLEIFPMSVIIREKDRIVYANSKTKELFKLKNKGDIVGKSLFDILDNKSKEIVRERIILESKEKIGPPVKETFLCADGSKIDVEVSVASIFIDNKEYFMGVLRDITHLKILKDYEIELEEKRHYELIRNEFFANVSHELKTPINVIYSALQLEEMYFDRGDYDNIKKNSKIIKQNCMRLLRLINNLIDITKIDAGFFRPVLKCNNIVEVIEDIVLSVAPYVESKKMSIVFDTEFEEEYVNCDADLIERILLNLISNSIKYGKPNGNINVNIYNQYKGFVSISVKDNGIGIAKDKLASVFERFIRVDKSLTRNCEGSGIGLSIVKSLVEIQKGTITLKSEESLGTELIIRFPLMEEGQEAYKPLDKTLEMESIIKKAELEFSDIY